MSRMTSSGVMEPWYFCLEREQRGSGGRMRNERPQAVLIQPMTVPSESDVHERAEARVAGRSSKGRWSGETAVRRRSRPVSPNYANDALLWTNRNILGRLHVLVDVDKL